MQTKAYRHRLPIVGLGIDHGDLPARITRIIDEAQVLVGGERLLTGFENHPADKVLLKAPLDPVIKAVEQELSAGRRVVLLADGDPGFFGIGRRITAALGPDGVEIHPNVTVLQAAAARLGKSWEGVRTASLHGRQDVQPLLNALAWHDMVAVFTDSRFHPGQIARTLLSRGVDTFCMHVFEDLAGAEERIRTLDLTAAAGQEDFAPLSFVILERTKGPELTLRLGLEDECYVHARGLITKKEVRAVGLALLQVEPHQTLWDLGAGCGSVGIEASLLARRGRVLAVEQDPARVAMIRENIRRTGAYGVEAVAGRMPECLASLPAPDRIFLGGGMGQGTEVLARALERLRPGGRLVTHLVLMTSLEKTRQHLTGLKYPYRVVHLQVSRSRALAGDLRLEGMNPVFVVDVEKRQTNGAG